MTFKEYLIEGMNPAMTLWHGGNLDAGFTDSIKHRKGKWEYGPGLYLTTHYDTARKYSKGGRKLYKVTIEKGTDINDVSLPVSDVYDFIDMHLIRNKGKLIKERLTRFIKNDTVNANIFLTNIINNDAIRISETNNLRNFLVEHGVDYSLVSSAFGWHEMMVVLFNMKKIIDTTVVGPKDEIEDYDLSTEFK